MSTLEQLAQTQQKYTEKIDAPNVFVPRSTARIGRAESLSRDIGNIFGTVANVSKDQYELGLESVKRLGIEHAATLEAAYMELEAGKQIGTDREMLSRALGEIYGGISEQFEDEDKKRVYESVFNQPAERLINKATMKWSIEQNKIDAENIYSDARGKTALIAKHANEAQVETQKSAYILGGHKAEEVERDMVSDLGNMFKTEITNNQNTYTTQDMKFNKEKYDRDFVEHFQYFAKIVDGKVEFRESNTPEINESIMSLYDKGKGALEGITKSNLQEYKKEILMFAESNTYEGMEFSRDGRTYKYTPDNQFYKELESKFGYIDEETQYRVDMIRADARTRKIEEDARRANSFKADASGPETFNQWHSLDTKDKKTVKAAYNREVDIITNSQNKDEIKAAQDRIAQGVANGYYTHDLSGIVKRLNDGQLNMDGFTQVYGRVMDNELAMNNLYKNLTVDEAETMAIRILNHKMGLDTSNETIKAITSKNRTKNLDANALDMINEHAAYDIARSPAFYFAFRALYTSGNEEEAERLLATEKKKYTGSFSLGGVKAEMMYGKNMKERMKEVNLAPAIQQALIYTILDDEKHKALFDKRKGEGIVIYPHKKGADQDTSIDNGLYEVGFKGDPNGQKILINLGAMNEISDESIKQIEDKQKAKKKEEDKLQPQYFF